MEIDSPSSKISVLIINVGEGESEDAKVSELWPCWLYFIYLKKLVDATGNFIV